VLLSSEKLAALLPIGCGPQAFTILPDTNEYLLNAVALKTNRHSRRKARRAADPK
jgi:hypothetical protein